MTSCELLSHCPQEKLDVDSIGDTSTLNQAEDDVLTVIIGNTSSSS